MIASCGFASAEKDGATRQRRFPVSDTGSGGAVVVENEDSSSFLPPLASPVETVKTSIIISPPSRSPPDNNDNENNGGASCARRNSSSFLCLFGYYCYQCRRRKQQQKRLLPKRRLFLERNKKQRESRRTLVVWIILSITTAVTFWLCMYWFYLTLRAPSMVAVAGSVVDGGQQQQQPQQRFVSTMTEKHGRVGHNTRGAATTAEKGQVQMEEEEKNHWHAIPNIVLFTHRIDLLHVDLNDFQKSYANLSLSKKDTKELVALQSNVQSTIRLHPGAEVRFLTDADCEASIRAVFDGEETALVDYFRNETEGMYKADLCRGAALWETGGLYFDADLGVRVNLFSVLKPSTAFATVRVHMQSSHRGAFFQAFIGSTARHPVLDRYVRLFLRYYRGTLEPPLDRGPVGVLLLKRAYDEIIREEEDNDERRRRRQRLLASPVSPSRRRRRRPVLDTSEIWQEVLYLADFENSVLRHVPPPTWGTRRACKFVVVADPPPRPSHHARHDASRRHPLVVPFYSRVRGSRMCPDDPPDDKVPPAFAYKWGRSTAGNSISTHSDGR